VVAALVAALVGLGCGSGSTGRAVPSPAASVGSPAASGGSPITGQRAPATMPLLDLAGTGTKKSAIFITTGEWSVAWSYDCARLGQGNFIITVYSGGGALQDILVNELGPKGKDIALVHASPGPHYLDVNSECAWTAKVTG
jgi:hypothetical protein